MTSRRPFQIFLIALASLGLVATTAPAYASTAEEEAAQFIASLADDAINVLNSTDGSIADREERFRSMLRNDFAMATIASFVVGRSWQEMTDPQRREYLGLFSEWVLKTYSKRLGGYEGERMEVVKTAPAGSSDVFVQTQIERAGGGPLAAEFRVRKIKDKHKIVDVKIEGVSLLVTQKADFKEVLNDQGVDGLLNLLRDRLTKLASNS